VSLNPVGLFKPTAALDTANIAPSSAQNFEAALVAATAAPGGDGKLTVVDLNSAGGLGHDHKNTATLRGVTNYGVDGLDLNNADLNQSINDLFGNGRNPDVITMQELPVKAALGTSKTIDPDIGDLKGIQQRLKDKTGDDWDVYYDAGGDIQYYRGEPGKVDGAGARSPSGTVIFVRRGAGSDVASSAPILPSDSKETLAKMQGTAPVGPNGVTFTNTNNTYDASFLGVRLTMRDGKEVDIYTCHASEVNKTGNEQIAFMRGQIKNYSGDRPVIFTGDFNTEMSDRVQLRNLVNRDGFQEASKKAGDTVGPYALWFGKQFDHIFTKGIAGQPVATAFNAPSSDHKGVVMTVDVANL
jgi:hypothetical protein